MQNVKARGLNPARRPVILSKVLFIAFHRHLFPESILKMAGLDSFPRTSLTRFLIRNHPTEFDWTLHILKSL